MKSEKPIKRSNKTVKIESTVPPQYTGLKRIDRYTQLVAREKFLELQYWDKFRRPNIAAKLKNFVFGGVLYDKYNGLRRDEYLLKHYQIKTIGFGAWVKNEDRINFLAALAMGLFDLQTIFKTRNLGKNRLQLDWGGIGRKNANGIFWGEYDLITMPRYKRPDKYLKMLEERFVDTSDMRRKYFDKVNVPNRGELMTLNKAGKVWIMGTAGWGSFAHEYGHFIDHYIADLRGNGNFYMTGKNALPFIPSEDITEAIKKGKAVFTEQTICKILTGRSLTYAQLNSYEQPFFDWLTAMYFTKRTSKSKGVNYIPNSQYRRLIRWAELTRGKWTYWGSIVELWARTFETYVAEVLQRKGVQNDFLVRPDKKFGRDIRYLDGGKVEVIDAVSTYPTAAHVWQNKKVFEKIINIFVKLNR